MTLSELVTILKGVEGFSNKVVYRAWSVGAAPELPYICVLAQKTDNFKADCQTYHVVQNVDVELYTQFKNPSVEALIESAFGTNMIPWDKSEVYIDSEEMFKITYEVTLI